MAEPAPASGETAPEPGRDPSSTPRAPAGSEPAERAERAEREAAGARDDEALAALAALAARLDPVPEKVADAARRAFARRDRKRCSRPEG